MPSALAEYLRDEIERRGWSDAQLATTAKITPGALSKILQGKSKKPKLDTLAKLAIALKAPLARIILLAGYELGESYPVSRDEQIGTLLQLVPEYREIVEELNQLTDADLQGLLGYARALRHQRTSPVEQTP